MENILLPLKKVCLQGEGTTENAAIPMLQVFLLFIKGQKKKLL